MRLSTILDHIDSGHVALLEPTCAPCLLAGRSHADRFQRGTMWTRDQVRRLFDAV